MAHAFAPSTAHPDLCQFCYLTRENGDHGVEDREETQPDILVEPHAYRPHPHSWRVCEICNKPEAAGNHVPARPEAVGDLHPTDAWRAMTRGQARGRGEYRQEGYDLVQHLYRQRAFSEVAFGPGTRTLAIIDHIQKELNEIHITPLDVEEWIDVVLLALDGAWRAGHSPQAIADALEAKLAKNEKRTWPDWRTADPNKGINHVKGDEHD